MADVGRLAPTATTNRAATGLTIDDVSIERRGLRLIDGLSVEVNRGQILTVMGPSGAGKTTLLRCVAGLSNDYAGTIGRGDERCAVVFQEPRLLPWRTAQENVELVVAGDGADASDRCRTWLERVGLGDATDLYPAQLSGGMQQRVAIARALAHGSPTVLVDEPFSSLDAATAHELRALLTDHLLDEQRAALWVTHNAGEAATVSEQTLHIDGPPLGTWRIERTPSLPTNQSENTP